MGKITGITKANYIQSKKLFEMNLEYTRMGAKNEYKFTAVSADKKNDENLPFPGLNDFEMSHFLIAPKIKDTTHKRKAVVELSRAEVEKTPKGEKNYLTANFYGKWNDRTWHPLLAIGRNRGKTYAVHWDIGRDDNDGFFYTFAHLEKIVPLPTEVRKIIPLDADLRSFLCLEGNEEYPGRLFIYGQRGISFICEMKWATDINFRKDYPHKYILAKCGKSETDITDLVIEKSIGDFNENFYESLDKIIERTIIIPFNKDR